MNHQAQVWQEAVQKAHFNPETTFKYSLPLGSHVVLKIFNLNGQIIDTLIDGFKPAGAHQTRWLAQDRNGNPVPNGVT